MALPPCLDRFSNFVRKLVGLLAEGDSTRHSKLEATLETETVDLQGESLEGEILEGESETELGEQAVTISHRLLWHEDVPFGLAGFRKEVRSASGMRIVAEAQLLEMGRDAESQ